MKLLKFLTSLTLVVSLLTLQIESGRLVLSQALAQQEQEEEFKVKEVKMTVSQITTIASIVVGASLMTVCPKQPSALVVAGGALALIAGEITGYSMFNSDSKKRKERVKENIKTNNDQEYLMREQAQQERDAARAVNAKSWLTMTAAIAYTVAAIISIIEGITDYPKFLGSCYASTSNDGARYIANYSETRQLYGPRLNIEEQKLGDHMAMVEDYSRFLDGEIKSMTLDEYEHLYTNYNDAFSPKERTAMAKVLDMLVDFVFPSAHAGGSNRGGSITSPIASAVSGVALTLITTAVTGSSPGWISAITSSAWSRAALFGVLGAAAWVSFAELRKAKGDLEENANKIDKVADKLKDIEGPTYNPTKPTAATPGSRGATGLNINGRDTNIVDSGPTGPCMTGSFSNMSYDANCGCLQTNSCTQIPTVSGNNQGFTQHLPPGFGASVGNFSSGVNDYLKGNSAGLDMANGAFGQNAAANLKRIKEQMMAKANDHLKKNKKAPIDLDKMGENLHKQLVDSIEKEMNKLPAHQLASLQNFGAGASTGTAEKKDVEQPQAVLASVPAPTGNTEAQAGAQVDFSDIEMNAAFDQSNLIGQEGEILDEYVTNESDISTKQSASIFQIISVRYVKSGYPRLLEKEKPTLE